MGSADGSTEATRAVRYAISWFLTFGVSEMSNEMDPQGRGGLWASSGAVVAAVLASACCLLPLVLGGLGLSLVSIAAMFESARPYFLGLTALFLGAGFYFAYFRRPGRRGSRQLGRPTLWVATLAAAALAFFPVYAPISAADPSVRLPIENARSEVLILRVEGMTCPSCATAIEQELVQVSGVESAAVSYERAEARVIVDPASRPNDGRLLRAVKKAGFRASIGGSDE